jgi:hypothetical protein
MEETIHALDTISGRIGDIPLSQFEHPAFAWHLVEVSADTKEVAPELVKPMSAQDWHAAHDSTPVAVVTVSTDNATPTTEAVQ